jgi:hypothetical protein
METVYEFRPTPGYFDNDFFRYADGKWIPDDGEYDLAFCSSFGPPICLYVETPYHPNILCSWLTGTWTERVNQHPKGNPWHYALKDYSIGWRGPTNDGYRESVNRNAGESGMDFLCKKHSCANGRHVEFHFSDPHIAAGLLRNRNTKEVFAWPDKLICMYCGLDAKATETVSQPTSAEQR